MNWPNNRLELHYTFDAAHRPVEIFYANGDTITMTWDSLGRRTGISRINNGSHSNWTYEPDGDLATLSHVDVNGTTYGYTYQHDAAGRIIDVTTTHPLSMTWQPWTNQARVYGPANNLNQVSSEAGGGLEFNENGNLIGYRDLSLGWTYGNRLKSGTARG